MTERDKPKPEVIEKEPRIRRKSRKRLQREAEQARVQRLQFLGQLASGLAHEIRNPLNGIQLNIDLLRDDLDSVDEDRREAFDRKLTRMRDEVDYLGQMVGEFLQFARPPQIVLTAVNINHLLVDLLEFQQPEFDQQHIDLLLKPAEDIYPILIDRQQFSQVIRNLLSNAREAIGENGRVVVRTIQKDEWVEVVVEDNGGGVPEEHADHIFDVFYTSKPQGTGLGLAIAARSIDEHGGRIWLENHPGRGATFHVRLPQQKILTAEEAVEAEQ
jgi:signal transduction histidine kinase